MVDISCNIYIDANTLLSSLMHVRLKLHTYTFLYGVRRIDVRGHEIHRLGEPMKEVANLTPNKVYVHQHYDIVIHIQKDYRYVYMPSLNLNYMSA